MVSKDGFVEADPAADIAKVALIQRHKGTAGITLALVQGFGFRGSMRCGIDRGARLPSPGGGGHG